MSWQDSGSVMRGFFSMLRGFFFSKPYFLWTKMWKIYFFHFFLFKKKGMNIIFYDLNCVHKKNVFLKKTFLVKFCFDKNKTIWKKKYIFQKKIFRSWKKGFEKKYFNWHGINSLILMNVLQVSSKILILGALTGPSQHNSNYSCRCFFIFSQKKKLGLNFK